jgi:CubicO group peptidase (beta-lactamase class C family)
MSDSRKVSDQKINSDSSETPAISNKSLSDLMKEAHIPGISIATLSHGKITESSVLGIADMESKTPVTTDTIFWACSLSKPVFAYLVIQLMQNGKLGKDFTLDTPLYNIFDDPKRFNNDERRKLITARMVLSHQTGMPNENKLDDKFDPGNTFRYSGEGYIYLQKVIEKYTKFPLEELAKKEIFLPLGMKHSSFLLPEPDVLATTHDEIMYSKIPLRLCPGNNNHPAASLHTTASDYALFLEACLKNELFIEIALKIPQISMEKDQEAIEKKVEKETLQSIHWGLGLALQMSTQTGMPELAFHWGHGPGARGFVAINLDSRSAVVYFANSENGLTIAEDVATPIVGNIKPAIDYLFKKYDYQYYPELEKRYHSLTRDEKNLPKKNNRLKWLYDLKKYQNNPIHIEKNILKEYLGTYGPLEIILKNNSLHMIFLNNDDHILIPLSETLFASKNDITFRLEFDKEKHQVTSHFLNPDWGSVTDTRSAWIQRAKDDIPRILKEFWEKRIKSNDPDFNKEGFKGFIKGSYIAAGHAWTDIIENDFEKIIQENKDFPRFRAFFGDWFTISSAMIIDRNHLMQPEEKEIKEIANSDLLDIYDFLNATKMSAAISLGSIQSEFKTVLSSEFQTSVPLQIHSVTKMFTGMLALKMVEKQIIPKSELEKTLADAFRGDFLKSLTEEFKKRFQTHLSQVTLFQLMTHKAGLGDYYEYENKAIEYKNSRSYQKAILDSLTDNNKHLPHIEKISDLLQFSEEKTYTIGEWHYSNVGITLVGLAIEYAYQQYKKLHLDNTIEPDFDSLLREFILKEAKIHPAQFTKNKPSTGKFNESEGADPAAPYITAGPAGYYWTTVEDLARFGRYFYSEYTSNERFQSLIDQYGKEFHPEPDVFSHTGTLTTSSSAFLSVSKKGNIIAIACISSDDDANALEARIKRNIFSEPFRQ